VVVALITAVALLSAGSMFVLSKEDAPVAVNEGDVWRGKTTVTSTVTVTTTEIVEPTRVPQEQSKVPVSDKHEFSVLDYVVGEPKASFRGTFAFFILKRPCLVDLDNRKPSS
jgi:hypothetical protein